VAFDPPSTERDAVQAGARCATREHDAAEARRRFEDDAPPQGPLTPTSSPRGILLPLGLQPRSFSSALGARGESSAPRLPVLELRGFRLVSSSSGLVRLRGVAGGHHVVSAPFRSATYCSAWLFESALEESGSFLPSSPATAGFRMEGLTQNFLSRRP
jgi:hypothetical protein